MNDDNEIICLECLGCHKKNEGTYRELFGNSPSLKLLPKMKCKYCGSEIGISFTGKDQSRQSVAR